VNEKQSYNEIQHANFL